LYKELLWRARTIHEPIVPVPPAIAMSLAGIFEVLGGLRKSVETEKGKLVASWLI
jgi:uncharacterized membrane protein